MPKRKASKKPPAPKKAWFPRIKKLTPRGFLSFAPDFPGVELGDLNVFIGANGSGKSNFFEAARFLQEAQRNLRGFLNSSSEVKDWVWDGAPEAMSQIEFDVGSDTLRYFLSVEPVAGVSIMVEGLEFVASANRPKTLMWRDSDSLQVYGKKRATAFLEAARPDATALQEFRDARIDKQARAMRDALASIQFFTEWGFGRAKNPVRGTQPSATIQGVLLSDTTNAPLRLNTMLQRKGFRERLLEHVTSVLPGVVDVLADFVMGSTQIVFMEANRAHRTPASRLSDGTLHWLLLGLILLDDENNSPLFLDEPELGLHPDAILALARLLKEASTRRQVIVSTHSELLLKGFGDRPECVRVFERGPDGTRVTGLDLSRVRKALKLSESGEGPPETLASLWLSGAIGGTRW